MAKTKIPTEEQKFPSHFMFQLTAAEMDGRQPSRSQSATLKRVSNLQYRPLAFTEHGAIMARYGLAALRR
jgi:hypothetical protein